MQRRQGPGQLHLGGRPELGREPGSWESSLLEIPKAVPGERCAGRAEEQPRNPERLPFYTPDSYLVFIYFI